MYCAIGECGEDGAMRLVNGTVAHQGRLEVCLNGVWGSVGDTGFDNFNANVLCNVLGYTIGG